MSCCGRTCSITFDGKPTEGYIGEINVEGEAVDVTKFGDGAAGTTIVCKETATVTINSYDDPACSVGEDVALVSNVCGNAYTAASCEVITKNCRFEASGVPYWVTTVRVNGSVVGF
jgi:hypothetical protein